MRRLLLLAPVLPLLAALVGVAFTWQKLERMKRIRGHEPGARVESHQVLEKWVRSSSTYWIRWAEGDIRRPGTHRLNLPRAVWSRYAVGDEIEIVFVPGDSSPHHREGIYASDGNFVFDYLLLACESGLALVSLLAFPAIGWYLRRSAGASQAAAGPTAR